MNVMPALASLVRAGAGVEPQLALPDSREFAARLTIGQILKGRVLRQYEGDRYLVAFDGQEKVVDSSVPLRTGDLLRGRVVALGDRVELQRLADAGEGDAAALPHTSTQPAPDISARVPDSPADVDAVFARFQAQLSPDGRQALVQMLRRTEDRAAVMLAGLTLARLGLPQRDALLQAVADALLKRSAAYPAGALEQVRSLMIGPELVSQLRDLIRDALFPPPSVGDAAPPPGLAGAPDPQASGTQQNANAGGGQASAERVGSLILNAQTGGSVAHRIGTLPLIVGDRLIEVDVAVFEHGAEGSPRSDARHRALVFVLNLKRLGRVEVAATVVEDRLRVRIAAQRSESTQFMSEHAAILRTVLAAAGWSVDEIVYETRESDTNPAARSVVEHVIAQDSVNRLM